MFPARHRCLLGMPHRVDHLSDVDARSALTLIIRRGYQVLRSARSTMRDASPRTQTTGTPNPSRGPGGMMELRRPMPPRSSLCTAACSPGRARSSAEGTEGGSWRICARSLAPIRRCGTYASLEPRHSVAFEWRLCARPGRAPPGRARAGDDSEFDRAADDGGAEEGAFGEGLGEAGCEGRGAKSARSDHPRRALFQAADDVGDRVLAAWQRFRNLYFAHGCRLWMARSPRRAKGGDTLTPQHGCLASPRSPLEAAATRHRQRRLGAHADEAPLTRGGGSAHGDATAAVVAADVAVGALAVGPSLSVPITVAQLVNREVAGDGRRRRRARVRVAGTVFGLQARSSAPPLPTCAGGAGEPYDLRKRILAVLANSHYLSTSHGLWTDWKMIFQDQQPRRDRKLMAVNQALPGYSE